MLYRKNANKTSKRKGQALVEYALLVAGIAVVCAVAVSVLGHKTADVLAVTAAVIPGAHAEDNAPINTGALMPTTTDANGNISLDSGALVAPGGVERYEGVFGPGGAAGLVAE